MKGDVAGMQNINNKNRLRRAKTQIVIKIMLQNISINYYECSIFYTKHCHCVTNTFTQLVTFRAQFHTKKRQYKMFYRSTFLQYRDWGTV